MHQKNIYLFRCFQSFFFRSTTENWVGNTTISCLLSVFDKWCYHSFNYRPNVNKYDEHWIHPDTVLRKEYAATLNKKARVSWVGRGSWIYCYIIKSKSPRVRIMIILKEDCKAERWLPCCKGDNFCKVVRGDNEVRGQNSHYGNETVFFVWIGTKPW